MKNLAGESYFGEIPQGYVPLEKNFVPFDKSIVWRLNDYFWQHTKLWEKMYGQHYEKSLPTGLSSSHQPEFIEESAKHFLKLNFSGKNIFILEQAPGTGKYAQGFLDYVEKNNFSLYEKITYVLSDTSGEILQICRENLKDHLSQISFYQQKSTYDLPKFGQKFLFARHGNFWDQLSCKLYQKKGRLIQEVYTQAFVEKKLANLNLPHLWKETIKSLRLKIKLTDNYLNPKLYTLVPEGTFIVSSTGVLKNLEGYFKLIDWENDGYLEVVDIFAKDRLPKKYDGAIAVPVNDSEIKEFLHKKNLSFSYSAIRGINERLRIFQNTLENLLLHEKFLSIAEIAPRKEESIGMLQEKTRRLFSFGADLVTFSDQAGASEQFLPIEELASSKLFSKLSPLMANIAVRRKSQATLNKLFFDLKKSGIKNVFILAGDPGPNDAPDKLTWQEVIPQAAKDFFVGAVAHPNISDLSNSLKKQSLGAKFLIVQASYDRQSWNEWLEKVKEEKLQEIIPLIPVIIPVTSKKLLTVLESLPDVPFAQEVKNYFLNLPDDETVKKEGIKMAKKLLQEYREEEIFSGVYLYSKSEEIIGEILKDI